MMEYLAGPTGMIDFFMAGLRLSVPLAFAALGGVLSERSGIFNIGLEGMILAGAFGAGLGTSLSSDPVVGLVFGLSMGALTGLVLGVLAVSLGVNQVISGVGINILALGLTSFLARIFMGTAGTTTTLPGFKPFAVPLLESIPVVGPVLFKQDILVYVMYLAVPGLFLFLFHTHWGLAIRAVGQNPRAADASGVPVNRIRYLCVLGSGALASLGGCYLVLSHVYVFSEGMSAGKGFIALAAVIFGRWNPMWVFLGCLLFGFCDAFQLRLQFANPAVPYQVFVTLPYVVSILALIGLVGRITPPKALGTVYRREEK